MDEDDDLATMEKARRLTRLGNSTFLWSILWRYETLAYISFVGNK